MIRVGILGAGVMGRRRAEAVRAHPGLQLIGVSDDAQASTRLLQKDLDMVFVCVPNDQAAPLSLAALHRDLHVFCEKPPARSVAEFLAVVDAAARRQRVLMVGLNHRLHGSVQRLDQVVASGELGRVRRMRGVYGKPGNSGWRTDPAVAGGGILLDQGIHMLDLLLRLAPDLEPVAAIIDGAPLEDDVLALLRSPDGVAATLHSSAREPRCIFRLEVVFDAGRVVLDGILSGSMAYAPERFLLERPGQATAVETFEVDHSWALEVARMADAVLEPRVAAHGAPADAVRVLRCIERIHEVGRA